MNWHHRNRLAVRLFLVTGVGSVSGLLGGPVAATVFAVYALVGHTLWCGSFARRQEVAAQARSMVQLEILSAALRAGLAPKIEAREFHHTVWEQVALASQLSERLGAPLAGLLGAIESELRATEQLRQATEANTAGTKITMLLLAVLPLAGVALGGGIGDDPVDYLLHTRTGASCAMVALLLQILGLLCFCGLLTRARNSGSPKTAAGRLPLAADLIAAVLRSGSTTQQAVAEVAVAISGPVGRSLSRVARLLESGISPMEAWRELGGLPDAQRLAKVAVLSAENGIALAGSLERLATDLRAQRSSSATAAVGRIAVLAVIPLGFCFLPAFVLTTVIPTVASIFENI